MRRESWNCYDGKMENRKARLRANSEDFLEEVGNGNMQSPFYQSFVNSLLGLAKSLEREMSNGTK